MTARFRSRCCHQDIKSICGSGAPGWSSLASWLEFPRILVGVPSHPGWSSLASWLEFPRILVGVPSHPDWSFFVPDWSGLARRKSTDSDLCRHTALSTTRTSVDCTARQVRRRRREPHRSRTRRSRLVSQLDTKD